MLIESRRIIALLLIPCLASNPAMAAHGSVLASRVKDVPVCTLMNEQALAARPGFSRNDIGIFPIIVQQFHNLAFSNTVERGQRLVGGNGLLPEQARRLAHILENRKNLKPQKISDDELRKIGKAIENLTKDKRNKRSNIIKLRIGGPWAKLYQLADCLEFPEKPVTIGGRDYYYEFKSVPGNGMLHIDDNWVWSFPVIDEPNEGEAGAIGTITIYISETDTDWLADESVARVIYAGAAYLILPQDKEIKEVQSHSLAFILEAVAGGKIESPRRGEEVVVPARVEEESILFPEMAKRLSVMSRAGEKVNQIERMFWPDTPVTKYLTHIAKVLQERPGTQLTRTPAANAPQHILPNPALPVSQIPAVNLARRVEAVDCIRNQISKGSRVIRILETSTGTSYPLTPEEALLAANDGYLLVKDKIRLVWSTNHRSLRVGGSTDEYQFEDSRTVRIANEAHFFVGKLKFRVSVKPSDRNPKVLRPYFIRMDSDEREYFLEFEERFYVGRLKGAYHNADLEDLEASHFMIRIDKGRDGGYLLILENLSKSGVRVEWTPPGTTGSSSAPMVNFMATGYIEFYAKKFFRWLGHMFFAQADPSLPTILCAA